MRRIIILAFVLLVLSGSVYLIYMVENEGFDSLKPLERGEYYRLLEEEKNPRDELTSFQATEAYLILYYDSAGLVNVYTLNGDFLYGIQIQTIKNGHGDFVFQDDMLYIMSRGNRMYLFREKNLTESFLYKESPEKFRQIEVLMENRSHDLPEGTTYYYLSNQNQIAKTTPMSTMTPVLSMPQANHNIPAIAFLLLITVAAFMHFLKHGKLTARS